MEPRNDQSQKAAEPRREERQRRFQIVRLEERIAPRIPPYSYQHHGKGWYKNHGIYP